MTTAEKAWIDKAPYEQLLSHWRFAAVGDPLLQGDTGDYYKQVMNEKKKALEQGDHVAASKAIGWQGPA